MKQRRCRTTGDIVTEEREAVDQNGKTEDNSKSSKSIRISMLAYIPQALDQGHVRSTEVIAALLRNGLNGNSGFGFLGWHFEMNYRETVEYALRVELWCCERERERKLGVTTDDLNLAGSG